VTAHALATGFSRGFLVAAAITLLVLLVAIVTIRVLRLDLADTRPVPDQHAASRPAIVQQHQDRAALAAAGRPLPALLGLNECSGGMHHAGEFAIWLERWTGRLSQSGNI
jgi:hypothetical protein